MFYVYYNYKCMRFTSLDPLRDRAVLYSPLLLSGSAVSTVGDSRESTTSILIHKLHFT